ncbi:thioesterase family protein [Limimaricola cinnabarinus]|uniref:thioesterase family protein n=1 Tax=Limimaricola cinnabarinus TaxID=1125964 RepID=UPI0009DBE60F|nr:thioesterase family protein [Limimaricola cinnabarinus]
MPNLDVSAHTPETAIPTDRPLPLVRTQVAADWIDYNGHMTEHRYLQVFSETTDSLLARVGVDADYVGAGHSYYTVETHLRHLGQARAGEDLTCATQILHVDAKRLHVFHTLHISGGADTPVATAEQMLIHVDAVPERAVPVHLEVRKRLEKILTAQSSLSLPEAAGRAVRAPSRPDP